jgi:hypothetical protein
MKMKQKLYISGAITGVENYKERFDNAEKNLAEFYSVVNPTKEVPYNSFFKWEDYMLADLKLLKECEGVYLLRGWENSTGAKIEKFFAERMHLFILFE